MIVLSRICTAFFFFFNDTAPTEIYTLSLHDALPIWPNADIDQADPAAIGADQVVGRHLIFAPAAPLADQRKRVLGLAGEDRKSTRLNSSHANISYAVFCLKKKKT